MNDLELEAYTQAKLTTFRRELEYAVHRPRQSWRSRTARLLRHLADGLEPYPLPAQSSRSRA